MATASDTGNITFLSEVSNALFMLLSQLNESLLLANNLDVLNKIVWYPLYGNRCGIFKPNSFFQLPFIPQVVGIDSHSTYDIKKHNERENPPRSCRSVVRTFFP